MKPTRRPRAARRLLAAAALSWLALAAPAAGAALPVPGVDPLPSLAVVEGHGEALARWVAAGVTGATVLHVDTHDDLQPVLPEDLAALRALVARRDAAAVLGAMRNRTRGLYHEGNFLRAAASLGIVREVVWVVPLTFAQDDPAADVRRYLRESRFPEGEVLGFAAQGACFRGVVGGLPLTVCAQEAIPRLSEPVLLSVDADYLPYAASFRGCTYLTALRGLVDGLAGGGNPARDSLLAYSTDQGYLPIGLRWLGDALAEALRDPALVRAPRPPERWWEMQKATGMLKDPERHDEFTAMVQLQKQLDARPDDPGLRTLVAIAASRVGGADQALALAESVCRLDRGCCPVLPEIGADYIGRGDPATGLRFLASADRLAPEMTYGLLDRGIALLHAARPREAVAAFARLEEREGAFPAGFLAGATQLDLGDREAARRAFDAALAGIAELERVHEIQVTSPEVEKAIVVAARFYRESGLAAAAERIERDGRLRLAPPVPTP